MILSALREGIFASIFAEISSPGIHVLVGVVYLPKGVNDKVTAWYLDSTQLMKKIEIELFCYG